MKDHSANTRTAPEENHGIPSGLAHFTLIAKGAQLAKAETADRLKTGSPDLRLLGICLCALYQAATCHRGCNKGPHLLEGLSARAYNHACAAFTLLTSGYYDEALNLVRGIGEIYHLVALSTVDQDAISHWIDSDKPTRMRDFSPSKVRAKLRRLAPELELTPSTWYSELSERYTHVTPAISPNKHNPERAIAGGIFQESGLEVSLQELIHITCGLSLMICRYFDYADLFEQISGLLLGETEEAPSD
ncbi:hypothetical protein [Methyloligella solikamskensis]|uniref:Uncharacterized protein n=1 Tax=Methyloligella solikamskensis TaxID=1177756 RepID=A0ABW3J8H4_9HYPH